MNVQKIVNHIHRNELMAITNRRETNILDISFKSIDSVEAMYLVNQFVDVYRDADINWSSSEINNLNEFLVEQVKNAKEELADAENTLKTYQEKETVFGVDEEIKPLLEQVTGAETELTNTVTSIKIAKDRKSYLEAQFSEKEKELAEKISSSIETTLEALRMELGTKESELIKAKKSGGNTHEVVKNLESSITSIRMELKKETEKMISKGISVANPLEYSQELMEKVLAVDAELSGLEAKKIELQKVVNLYSDKLVRLPQKQLQYIRLERDRVVLQQTYLTLRKKYEETKIQKASEGGKIRIIDRAKLAERISPKKKRDVLLGFIFGIAFSLGVILLFDFLDNTIRTIDDVDRSGIPLLGVIPYIGDTKSKIYKLHKKGKEQSKNIFEKKLDSNNCLITHIDPKSPISEAYRVVRTNITFSSIEEEVKTIMISSPGPGEGKTTTLANLAITFANLDKKTLIVDCDMRKPRIHSVFGLKNDKGLLQALVSDDDPTKYIKESEGVENLYVMSSGGIPPNPSELLGSQKMLKIIKKLKSIYDIVLFDTPPFTAVTDPIMVAKEMNKNFLVVKAGQTDKNAFYRSILNLDNINASASGIIVNWLSKSTSHDANYYYQNYYQYYNE